MANDKMTKEQIKALIEELCEHEDDCEITVTFTKYTHLSSLLGGTTMRPKLDQISLQPSDLKVFAE